ncbi:S-layer homology domain-containing protein [Paenibacillus sp. NEAU-GSW1]|uniref:S-layer homology domain-containing protein n=1 Tax=Paenibacillus sp. NEAU-GSW1 TaxID=2682486 RepID=UPI0012E1B458|nr:S-layer homology domain-containing protein [Paenibacillus sp. NEAU-GSW1]MUT65178.1 hypothetical protein [Paenibacillus sp. NEAU-GSW1]
MWDTALSVTSNVGLSALDGGGRAIRWTSSDNGLLNEETGAISRPSYTDGDAQVTLNAEVDANGTTYEKVYDLTIKAADITNADIQGHWARTSAETLAAKLIIEGRSDGSFDPGAGLTRAETAALLVRAIGIGASEAKAGLSNISGKWYEAAVSSAYTAGLVTGCEDGTFCPDGLVTREELAVILARAAAYSSGTALAGNSAETQLSDAESVAGWAAEAVRQMAAAGIVRGDADGRFKPQVTAVRAEMAVMLNRLLEMLGCV